MNSARIGLRRICRLFFSGVILAALVAVPQARAAERSITIAAAGDLAYALKDVSSGFERASGVKTVLSFGSSGLLSRQIQGGAPFDVFMSADKRYVAALEREGLVMPDTVSTYARGVIVVAFRSGAVSAPSLDALRAPGIRRIAIANPDHAPYGRAAMEALKARGLWDAVKPRIVYGEDIRQAANYVKSGEVDAGILSISVAAQPGMTYGRVDPALHGPIEQTLGVVKGTKDEAASREFIKYLKGPQAKAILREYGFMVPD